MATPNKKLHNNGGEEKDDRLSSLPDAILIEILSLLPLQSAIVTGTLSTRWRNLWTQITSLYINNHNVKTFYLPTTIDVLIPQLSSPLIRKFKVHFNYLPENKRKVKFFHSCFRLICGRKVEEIQVSSDCKSCNFCLMALPSCVLRAQSLVKLDLGVGFGLNLRIDDDDDGDCAINLPNLKKLKLHLFASDCELLGKLIKSCPVLEEVFLHLDLFKMDDDDDSVIDISGHNVRKLGIWVHEPSCAKNTKVVILGPKLEFLDIAVKYPLRFYFVENPIGLVKADVKVLNDCSPDKKSLMMELFGAISDVRSLVVNGIELGPSTWFPNVTHLTFTMGSSTLCEEAIALVLQCCPVLEDLHMHLTSEYVKETSNWDPQHSTPASVLPYLKKIELKIDTWKLRLERQYSLNLVKHMLSIAPVLDRLILIMKVYGTECNKVERREELLLLKELSECPRSSLSCQIEFSGKQIKVSGQSKKFRGPNGHFISLMDIE